MRLRRSNEKDSADVEDRRVGDGSGLQLVISIFGLRLGIGFRIFRDQGQGLEFGNLSLSMKYPGVMNGQTSGVDQLACNTWLV